MGNMTFGMSALLVLISLYCFAGETEWVQTDKTDDGITVFKREFPGSDVVAFRGEGVVDAPLPLVASIIFDASRGPEWIANLKESRPLRWENPTTFIEYDHVGTPFVLKDRDFVTRASATLDPAQHSVTIEYKAAEDSSAPVTAYVRGEMIHAKFTLTALGSGAHSKTAVSGDIHCDPKGSVPKWIVNFFQKDWPINTFRSLRKQAKKPDVKVNPKFASVNE